MAVRKNQTALRFNTVDLATILVQQHRWTQQLHYVSYSIHPLGANTPDCRIMWDAIGLPAIYDARLLAGCLAVSAVKMLQLCAACKCITMHISSPTRPSITSDAAVMTQAQQQHDCVVARPAG